MRTLRRMQHDQPRLAASTALRDLNHAFVAHDPDDEQLVAIAQSAQQLVAQCERAPRRDRLALMRAASAASGTAKGDSFPIGASGSGFADRAVGGADNPTGVDIEVEQMTEEIVARASRCAVRSKAHPAAPTEASSPPPSTT